MTDTIRLASCLAAALAFGLAAFQPLLADAEEFAAFRASVASRSLAPVGPRPDLLIVGHPVSAIDAAGVVRTAAMNHNALIAVRLQEPTGQAMVLIAPEGNEVLRVRLAPVRPPPGGAVFSRTEPDSILPIVEFRGFRLGIAAATIDEQLFDRMAERGVDLVLIASGYHQADQVQNLSNRGKELGLNLFFLPACALDAPCPESLAVPVDGARSRGDKASLTLRRNRVSTVPSAYGLPSRVPWPAGTKESKSLVELGRLLFFSPVLSADGTVSCASCHRPQHGFADLAPTSSGASGRMTQRNTPGLLNVAFRSNMRWDAYSTSIEQFIKYPVSGRDEMNEHRLPVAANRVAEIPGIGSHFQSAFGSPLIDFPRIEHAIGAYVRTLVSGNSAFDRAVVGGQPQAMSSSAWRGFALFNGRAGCASCHTWSPQAPFFTDEQLHSTGWGWDSGRNAYRDDGAGGLGISNRTGQFRTPTLRDLAFTAPYMHDGSFGTLREVIDFFDRGGGPGPGRDPRLRRLNLSESEKVDLEQFLIALTGQTHYDSRGRRTN